MIIADMCDLIQWWQGLEKKQMSLIYRYCSMQG